MPNRFARHLGSKVTVSAGGVCVPASGAGLALPRTIARVATFIFGTSVAAHVFGPGYAFVEIREHSVGIDTCLWVPATPVDGALIEMSASIANRRTS